MTFTGEWGSRDQLMEAQVFINEKSLELKKHVGLIHSTNELTLLERKIANALLYNAFAQLRTHNEHQIHIPYLCKLIGYNSNDFKTIKKSLMSLISTVLEWNLLGEQDTAGSWNASSIIADAKIEGSICVYSYSNRMRELCCYPEFYGKLNMAVLARFKSTYGIALYENCARYQNINKTPWFTLQIYRKLMGVVSGKYELFRDLNKRVIKPSVAEVNNQTDIHVMPEFKKHGRGVVAIRFLINRKEKSLEVSAEKGCDSEQTALYRLIGNYGCSKKQANELIESYGLQYLQEKMSLIESSLSFKNGKIKHLSKYLQKALSDDFQAPKSSKEHLDALRLEEEKKDLLRKTNEKNQQKFRDYQNRELVKMLRDLPLKERRTIERKFDEYIKDTLYYSVYLKEGLDNPLVRDRFGTFIRNNYPNLAATLGTIDQFISTAV